MNTFNRIERLKTQANFLLKDLNNATKEPAQNAAERFLQLPFLKYSNAANILADKSFFRLKHAYHVLAIEAGHTNWVSLREQLIKEDCMYHSGCSTYLNIWFANYNEAYAYFIKNGGYLLSYRQYFYVCNAEVIKVLKLDKCQAEWEAIGYNWVKPANINAYNRIYKQAKQNYLSRKTAKKKAVTNNRPEWLKLIS